MRGAGGGDESDEEERRRRQERRRVEDSDDSSDDERSRRRKRSSRGDDGALSHTPRKLCPPACLPEFFSRSRPSLSQMPTIHHHEKGRRGTTTLHPLEACTREVGKVAVAILEAARMAAAEATEVAKAVVAELSITKAAKAMTEVDTKAVVLVW